MRNAGKGFEAATDAQQRHHDFGKVHGCDSPSSIALPMTTIEFMSGFRIAAATRSDVPQVLAMIRALAEYEQLSHLCVATETDLANHLFASPARIEVLLGKENGEAVCFALFFHNFSTFLGKPGLYLEDLFVRPEFRRHGYGRAMLVRLAQLALERGCGRFEWSVLDWNEPAIRFYQSLGAIVLPDWRITRVTGPALSRLAGQAVPAGNGA
jgi:GNAT superfamily N-acetyltransferase